MDPADLLTPEGMLRRLHWQVIRRLDGRLQGDYRTLLRGDGTAMSAVSISCGRYCLTGQNPGRKLAQLLLEASWTRLKSAQPCHRMPGNCCH